MRSAGSPAREVQGDGGVRPGRKRDSTVADRVTRAGVDVFAAEGWRGFTIEAIARAAGAGKSSIYLRYATREELFLDILNRHGYHVESLPPDTGDLHQDLRAFATSYAAWLEGPQGPWGIRLFLEARLNPDFAQAILPHAGSQIAQAHEIVRRAKRRGELPRRASAAVILDTLLGGILHHAMSIDRSRPGAPAAGRRFIDDLVRHVVAGARHADDEEQQ